MKWRHDSPVDESLLLLIVGLTVAGIVAVFSATYPVASKALTDGAPGDPYKFLAMQTIYALIGAVLCAVFAFIPPERIRRWAPGALLTSLVLMVLVFVPGIGKEMGGAHRWVRLPHLMFQPSEMAKVALVAFVAWRISMVKDWAKEQYKTFAVCLVATGILGAICVREPDLGSAVVMFSIVLATFFFAGLDGRVVALTGVGAVGLALVLARIEPYRWARITTFLHPTRDTGDSGYHVARMLITLARGGLVGQGLGLSREKWLALPARQTDSIFCVIGAEVGFIGAALLVIAFFFFLRRAVMLARSQPDVFSTVLTAGLGASIGIQAFVNMGVACGLLPCTGVTLPFISSGGSSLVCTLIASGMLLSLSRQSVPEEREA